MDSILSQKSLSGAKWLMPDTDLAAVEKIARAHDVPELIARLLLQRGVPEGEIERFLNPTLKTDFPDPNSLKDMYEMAEFVSSAILDGKSFAIFGDFDVDGATSSAVLHRFLRACDIDAPIYIPDRLTEGYGPNVDALKQLKENGADIVFLLDCGTTSFDVVQAGADMGLAIIIVDHHEAEDKLPAAKFVINPKRKDDTSGLNMLAACGVTFMVCVAVNAVLRRAGFWEGRAEAALKDWLDLVALGTVCDMVPLQGVNRLLVRSGFMQMQTSSNVGLNALIGVSGINSEVNTYHAGFVLGPRINAGSRVHDSSLGAKLLTLDDAEEARNIAWTLNDCNDKRKSIQQAMENEAIAQVEAHGLDQHPLIFVKSENFHQGLSGLVAGRIKDKYGKPACVAAPADESDHSEWRGSGRSVAGIHIAQAFIDARNAGIIEKGGGHAMAGGFSVSADRLDAFREFLYAHVAKQAESLEPNILTHIDGIVTVRGANVKLVNMIQRQIGPFGQEAPEPLFLFKNVRIHSADVLGDAHVRVMISDWEGGSRMKAMAFRAVGTPMGDAFLKQKTSAFNILGTLKIDTWGGNEKVEMHIRDADFASV